VVKRIYILSLTLVMLLALMAACTNTRNSFITGMHDALPIGWEMKVIDRKGAMEPPHGLDEPVFRIDFINHTEKFNDIGGREIFPNLRLYFYDLTQRDAILKIIEDERIYSWNVPDYFDETAEYILHYILTADIFPKNQWFFLSLYRRH
jgi:hypothetical protein